MTDVGVGVQKCARTVRVVFTYVLLAVIELICTGDNLITLVRGVVQEGALAFDPIHTLVARFVQEVRWAGSVHFAEVDITIQKLIGWTSDESIAL